MIILWGMLGLTAIGAIILAVNLKIYRKNKAERKRIAREQDAELEATFQRNCQDAGLTPRVIDTVRLVLAGNTYKETGEILFISEKTVESHMGSAYAKLGVKGQLNLYKKLYGQP